MNENLELSASERVYNDKVKAHEEKVNDPNDPTDAELVDVDTETLDSIMDFLEDMNYIEMDFEDF